MNSPLQLSKEIAIASNEALKAEDAFRRTLAHICAYTGWPVGHVCEYDPQQGRLVPSDLWFPERAEDSLASFRQAALDASCAKGEGLPGRVLESGGAVWIPDILKDANLPRAQPSEGLTVRGAIAFPVRIGEEIAAVLEFFSPEPSEPDPTLLDLMEQAGVQLGRVVERERAASAFLANRLALEENVARRTAELTTLNESLKRELEQRERIETALRDSEAMYHSLVEHAPLSIYRKDLKGHVVFGNASYGKDLGIDIADLLGKTDFDLFSEEQASQYVADDRRVIETGDPLRKVERHEGAHGTIFVEVLKTPIYDHKGNCTGTQGIFWDVTEEYEARRKLEESTAELKRSNEDLAQFAYVASHDLQEPLRMITSYMQLLELRYSELLDESGREFVHFAMDGAERMKNLIRALLEYSRIGTKAAPHEPVPLDAVLADVLGVLQVAIQETGATVTADPLPEVPCDRIQISQLFQNLIGNALKFCRDRPPEIHISAARGSAQHQWTISVRDNGIGIEAAHLERIFVIFQRLHSREAYPGTGIGLALCKRIIERHHGKISVDSELGKGTIFHFTLPE
jgi:PAS domain S-box-containing protein